MGTRELQQTRKRKAILSSQFDLLLVKTAVQAEESHTTQTLFCGLQACTKNIIHKKNHSGHFGKEYDFKCPAHQVICICKAQNSASFPVSSQIYFKLAL